MAQLERKTQKVDRWLTSDQKLRWCAAALLAVEQQFRRVQGYTQLPLLERALMTTITPSMIAAACVDALRPPPEYQLDPGHTR